MVAFIEQRRTSKTSTERLQKFIGKATNFIKQMRKIIEKREKRKIS